MAATSDDDTVIGEVRVLVTPEANDGRSLVSQLLRERFGAAWVDAPHHVVLARSERTGEVLARRRFRRSASAERVRLQLLAIANDHGDGLRAGTFDWQLVLDHL